MEDYYKKALPYERAAQQGEPLPAGLSYPDEITYLSLRMVYAAIRDHVIDTAAGKTERAKLIDDLRVWKYQAEMGTHWVQLIKDTELARAEYRKNPCKETADALVNTLEGLK